MSHKVPSGALACALAILTLGVSNALAAPVPLLLSQSLAFTYLGHSCGGIQEHAYATGFDATSGYPVGDVYISTRCGGSGRGGGYKTTTYSAWVAASWDFAGTVRSSSKLTAAPAVDSAFSAYDANGDEVYNTSTGAYLVVPAPGAPTGVSAVQVGDGFQVSWTPAPPNPAVITSSTITATPVDPSLATVTVTVIGSASTGLVAPLQPQTAYEITVVSATAGGSSSPSDPLTATTAAASVAPSAPTGVKAHWTAPGSPSDTLVATWLAAQPGDSPTDAYEVTISGSDGGGTFTQDVSGSTLSAVFAVSDIPDWSVRVRAHNAAGWSPWSTAYTLGGV
jgi:hypothetical protein